MTTKKIMLVGVDDDETRIATVTGGTLNNLHIEQTHNDRIVGNIYRGVVVQVHTSFQAAFIDYGAGRHGFLAFSDISNFILKNVPGRRGRTAIEKVLKPGQSLMVQVMKNEMGNKGAGLTTNISLPGRFLVFIPNSDKGGVSKKIDDEEARMRLKHLLEGLCGKNDSVIIRTAGIDRSLPELKRDLIMLRRKWNKINQTYESTSTPQLLYEEENVVVRTLRDFFIDDISEIWIDHPEAFHRAREFFRACIRDKQRRLHFYSGDRSLFSAYEIEDQIEMLSSNRVPLPSGGSLVIDPTEALVAIDVNSGRSNQEKNIESTALRTNMEAAEEIARQLRLRNLGGLIVIDFIDMIYEKNRNIVVKTLEEHLQHDKAKWTLGTISQFGLLEMSRQRIARELSQETKTVCPSCGGNGMVLSVPSLASAILRKVRELSAMENTSEIFASVSVELANFLFNKKRRQLEELEAEFGIKIYFTADITVETGKMPTFEVKNKDSIHAVPAEEGLKNRREKREHDETEGRVKRPRPTPRRNKHKEPEEPEPSAETAAETKATEEPAVEETIVEEIVAEESTPSSETDNSLPGDSGEDDNSLTDDSGEDSITPLSNSTSPANDNAYITTLFRSVHRPSPTEENRPAKPDAETLRRQRIMEIPPGTVLYSSVHRSVPSSEEAPSDMSDSVSNNDLSDNPSDEIAAGEPEEESVVEKYSEEPEAVKKEEDSGETAQEDVMITDRDEGEEGDRENRSDENNTTSEIEDPIESDESGKDEAAVSDSKGQDAANVIEEPEEAPYNSQKSEPHSETSDETKNVEEEAAEAAAPKKRRVTKSATARAFGTFARGRTARASKAASSQSDKPTQKRTYTRRKKVSESQLEDKTESDSVEKATSENEETEVKIKKTRTTAKKTTGDTKKRITTSSKRKTESLKETSEAEE